ncbi:MAG: homoserine kinase [Nakamurella sp.]
MTEQRRSEPAESKVPGPGQEPAGRPAAGNAVTVRVPATSANLGPGFDSFGLALGRYDEATAALQPDGLLVEVTGVGAGEVPLTHEHLVVRAIARAFNDGGRELPGLRLSCTNCIPHGGGLGSSASAIVAGLLLGRELLAGVGGDRLTDQRILELGTELEGHPDNVAPALLGGFTLAFMDANGAPAAVRRDVHPDIRVIVFSAHQASATSHTRGLLPATVPHSDASANAAAAGLLVHAITVDPAYLLPATRDRLHQDYRAPAMPESARLVEQLRAAEIAAVISGAGPSVIALTTGAIELESWRRPGFDVAAVAVSTTGAQIHPD